MIDLSTDEGMGRALRTIAEWDTVPTRDARVADGPTTRRGPTPRVRLATAAALVLVLAVGAVALLQQRRTMPASSWDGAWHTMAPAPLSPRLSPVIAWSGTEMLVWGGWSPADGIQGPGSDEAHSDGAAYDPGTDSWRRLADVPWSPREPAGLQLPEPYPSAVASGTVLVAVRSERRADGVWQYDIATDTWSARGAPFPTVESLVPYRGTVVAIGYGRSGPAMATFDVSSSTWGPTTRLLIDNDGQRAVFDGTRGSPALLGDRYLLMMSDVWSSLFRAVVIDLETGEEIPVDVPWGDEVRAGVFHIDDGGVAVGAVVRDDVRSSNGNDVWESATYLLDSATMTWEERPSRPGSASTETQTMPEMATVPGGHVLIGGQDSGGGAWGRPQAAWTDSDLSAWSDLPDPPVDPERIGAAVIWTGDGLIVWGGSTFGEISNVPDVPLDDGAVFTPHRTPVETG